MQRFVQTAFQSAELTVGTIMPTAPDQPRPVVLKLGGSSVADPQCWRHIAEVAREHVAAGERPVLVCSAVGGVTDALERVVVAVRDRQDPAALLAEVRARHERLAEALGLDCERVLGESLRALEAKVKRAVTRVTSAEPGAVSPRWHARVLASGELLSTRLGAAWLERAGLPTRWLDARSVLLARPPHGANDETTAYLSACCDHAFDAGLRRRVLGGDAAVTITQGFIARNAADETVVLGRGGSDTAAAYIAAILGASRLEIWTDVPGLFTADPRRATGARMLSRLSYEEAAVLGALGAKVLHPRCLGPVQSAGIPLAIRWTHRPEHAGTVIGAGPEFERPGIRGIASRGSICLVRMCRDRSWQPVGFMADVSRCFRRRGLSMDLIASSPSEIRATIDLAADPGAAARLPELLDDLRALSEPSLVEGLACVSVAGTEISRELPRLAAVQRHLGEASLHLVCHAADDTHISYVVDAALADDLVAEIHGSIFEHGPRSDEDDGPTWSELDAAHVLAEPSAAVALPTLRAGAGAEGEERTVA